MDKFLTNLVDKLWVNLEPKVTHLITTVINQTMETWLPKLGDLVEQNLDKVMAEWLPKIIKAVIIATSQAVRGIAVDSEDKLTNLIPGTMDDAIFDPIVKNVSDIIGKIGL